jgi:hypothetical protein
MPSEIFLRALGRRDRMRLTRFTVGLMVAGLLVLGFVDRAISQGQAGVAKLLRVEWEQVNEACCPPRLVGQIHNSSIYRIGSVRLRIETLDGSNQVVREALAWIYVTVPARGTAQFSLRRPPGDAFRLSIESFVLIAREGDQTP